MFVVFYMGAFVDFWLNQRNDKMWIERTIELKGWDKTQLEVYWYAPDPRQIGDFEFDDETREAIPFVTTIEDEEEVRTPDLSRKIVPEVWFKNGERLIEY